MDDKLATSLEGLEKRGIIQLKDQFRMDLKKYILEQVLSIARAARSLEKTLQDIEFFSKNSSGTHQLQRLYKADRNF
jgi:hypothetical protein